MTPQEAALELLRRRRGRSSLAGYANAIEIPGKPATDDPDEWLFGPVESGLAAHHLLLLQTIERAASRRYGRFMLFLPPGAAKSTFASVVAPTYFMGRNPGTKIILASYGSDLARKHGRRARQIVRSSGFSSLFGTEISKDSSAANEWALTNGSEYLAAGLLAGLTGNRAHGAIIDDPIKGREQADSPTIRAKTWDAYTDDLQTRLIPGGWIGIVQCMTGDTPVMMADGSERDLGNIRPGDKIATYDAGSISTSTVTNWRSNGTDFVFRIKTRSGAIVKANGRHPFLILKGCEEVWTRLKDLVVGDRILRATGGNGEASCVLMMDAEDKRKARGCATPTTTRCGGPKESGHHHPEKIHHHGSVRSSSTGTESSLMTTGKSSPDKAVPARSAEGCRKTPETQTTGATSCASIIATTLGGCVGCCATTAISRSAEQKHPKCLRPLPSTCDVIADEIISIEPAGKEEVFDVQVERTENFIADGLVSHNTRWHEDDLSGRLLPKDYAGESGMVECRDGRMWEIINLPAECERADDPLGRKVGEMLWPEWFDASHWAPFRKQSRTWASLFQQRPRPDEGGIFKDGWCVRRWATIPREADLCVHSWDTAQKPDQLNDPSVGTMWRMGGKAPGYYLADLYRERVDYPTLRRKVMAYAERDRPAAVLIEDKSSGQSLIQELRTTTTLPVIAIEPHGSKLFRANEVSSMVESGLLILPESAPWLVDFEGEFFGFPLTTHDDQVDSVTQFLKWVRGWSRSVESYGAGMTRTLAGQMTDDDLEEAAGGWGSVGRGTDMDGFN